MAQNNNISDEYFKTKTLTNLNNTINLRNFKNTLNRLNDLQLFIESFENNLEYINNKDLIGKINLFKSKYEKFSNIKRFAIPVIGKINSGKSTFLNYLLDLYDLLESSEKITTKFICLIRHSKYLQGSKPKFFKVKIEERIEKVEKEESFNIIEKKENEIFYNFIKDEEITGNVKEIIEDKNKFLSDKTQYKDYNDYFYILEAYIPFFSNFGLEEFSDYFEFVDVPGLNEISDKFEKDNLYIKFLSVFKNNICFSIFIFDSEYYHDEINTKEILLKFKEKLNNCDNNSLYILNKSDLCSDLKKSIKIFKDYIFKELKIKKEDEKNILDFSSKNFLLKKRKKKEFKYYLEYIIDCSEEETNFIENLIVNLKNDFGIEIKENFDDYDYLSARNYDKKESNKIIEEINNKINLKNLEGNLIESDYFYYRRYYEENKNKFKKNDFSEKENNLYENLRDSIINFIQNLKILNEFNNFEKEILNNLKIDSSKHNEIISLIENKKFEISFDKFKNKNFNEIFKLIKPILEEIIELEPNEYINEIYNDYIQVETFLSIDKPIRVCIIGGYSTGKSSMLNGIIGYNLNILPESSEECTKIGIIIKYVKNKEEISLYNTKNDINSNSNNYNFLKQNYYFIEENKLIVKGEKEVIEKLKQLNDEKKNELNNKENKNNEGGIDFYILKTPIQFLDNYDIKEKEKIEFIDFPGLNKSEETEKIISNLFNCSDYFIFCNSGNIIKEKGSQKIFEKILNKIMIRKDFFDFNKILFIINKFDLTMKNKKNDKKYENFVQETLSQFKNDIIEIIQIYKENLNFQRLFKDYKNINDKNILTSYFSKKKFMYNYQKYKEFIDNVKNNDIIESIMKKNINNVNKDLMIKSVNYKLKTDYIENLNQKDLFKYFQIPSNYDINKYKNNLNKIFENYEPQLNEKIIDEIIKQIIFLEIHYKNNKFSERFEDFFNLIKTKINEKDYLISNNIIFKYFNNLLEKFNNIRLNIITAHNTKVKNSFNYDKIKKDLKKKYDDILNEIKTDFDLFEFELKNLVEQMKNDEDKERDIKLKYFKKKCSEKEEIINNKINDFCKYLENEKKKILSEIFKFDNVSIKLKLRNDVNINYFLGGGALFGGLVAGGIHYTTLFSAVNFMQCLTFYGVFSLTGLLGFGVLGSVIWGANKIINIFGKKKDIEDSFVSFFEDFNAIKVKLKDQIEKFYNEKIKEIDDILKSQNIVYKDINKWNKIIDKFLDLKMIFVDKFK